MEFPWMPRKGRKTKSDTPDPPVVYYPSVCAACADNIDGDTYDACFILMGEKHPPRYIECISVPKREEPKVTPCPRTGIVWPSMIPNLREPFRGGLPEECSSRYQFLRDDDESTKEKPSSYEVALVHHDCLVIYLRQCHTQWSYKTALEKLWLAGAWRESRPTHLAVHRWRGYKSAFRSARRTVEFDEEFLPLSRQGFNEVATAAGLCDLVVRLPAEIVLEIQRYCLPDRCDPHRKVDNLFWRASSTITLANMLKAMPEQPFVSIPFGDILMWERGGRLEMVGDQGLEVPKIDDTPNKQEPGPSSSLASTANPGARATVNALPVVRITIDIRGVSKVERLPCWPTNTTRSTEAYAFMVDQVHDLSGNFEARIKDGLLSLAALHETASFPVVWDTPTPPRTGILPGAPGTVPGNTSAGSRITRLVDLTYQNPDTSWKRLNMIDLRSVSGLTFTFYSESTYCLHTLTEIHPHYQHRSDLKGPGASRARNSGRGSTVHIYLPVPPEDRIVYLGVKVLDNSSNLGRPLSGGAMMSVLVRQRLAGDVYIGPIFQQEHEEHCNYSWSMKDPEALILGTSLISWGEGALNFVATSGDLTDESMPSMHDFAGEELHSIAPYGDYPPITSWALVRHIRPQRDWFSFHSSAPLSNVASVTMFFSPTPEFINPRSYVNGGGGTPFPDFGYRGACPPIGVLLRYTDGSQRTLGQVQLGWTPLLCERAPTKTVENPTGLWVETVAHNPPYELREDEDEDRAEARSPTRITPRLNSFSSAADMVEGQDGKGPQGKKWEKEMFGWDGIDREEQGKTWDRYRASLPGKNKWDGEDDEGWVVWHPMTGMLIWQVSGQNDVACAVLDEH